MQKITASQIVKLLKEKHLDDIFVDECKDGPTWGANHLRLDGWAMTRSWSHFCTTGYEIKVSRSDFLRDIKIVKYLNLCHQLYLVCPVGVCVVEEIPKEIGLLVPSTNCTRLYIKKKAPYRDITVPWEMLAYVLMSRAQIRPRDYTYRRGSREEWEKWMADSKIDREFGYRVSKKIRKRIEEEIEEVKHENDNLVRENKRFDEIKTILTKFGITKENASVWMIEDSIKARLQKHERGITDAEFAHIQEAINTLSRAKEILEGKK